MIEHCLFPVSEPGSLSNSLLLIGSVSLNTPFPFSKGTNPQETPAGPFLLFAMALPMHGTACAAATARAAGAAADMPARFLVQDQPSDNQHDNHKEDQNDCDRSDICL